MARDTIERELSATRTKGVRFEVATAADDADIRRLLRENPMPGRIGISFEREPDYFADACLPGELKQTIVARGQEDFRSDIKGGKVGAFVALWDQRIYKQTVIRSYEPALNYVRPALNLLAHFTGLAKLPSQGGTLANAFVSHLAAEPHDSESLIGLFTELRAIAAQRGIELITAGFAANDPRLAELRNRFRGREYYSRLYLVRWSEDGKSDEELDGRILAPEVALL